MFYYTSTSKVHMATGIWKCPRCVDDPSLTTGDSQALDLANVGFVRPSVAMLGCYRASNSVLKMNLGLLKYVFITAEGRTCRKVLEIDNTTDLGFVSGGFNSTSAYVTIFAWESGVVAT
jgi:hypothetical protein